MTDDTMKDAARMLALNGLRPRDIGEALNVSEHQVRQWLQRDPDDQDDDLPPAA